MGGYENQTERSSMKNLNSTNFRKFEKEKSIILNNESVRSNFFQQISQVLEDGDKTLGKPLS